MNFSVAGTPAVGSVVSGRSPVTSLSYHEDGKRLYVASEADSRLQVIECLENGQPLHVPIRCERERIHLVQATHHEQCVLFAGKGSSSQPMGQRNAIHYLSLYDNKILRKFRGHSDTVTLLSMSPADDCFLSASSDRTVKLWDLKSAGRLAELKLPEKETATSSPTLAAFDSTGLVFAISCGKAADGGAATGQYLHLYDARKYTAGAFAELQIAHSSVEAALQQQANNAAELSQAAWTSLQFNVSGNQFLAGTDKGVAILLDGFEGTVQRVLVPPDNAPQQPAVTTFTPDDRTVLLAGQGNGAISAFDAASGALVQTLQSHHPSRVGCLAVNPKYAQIASSCTQTALWIW